MAGRYILAVDIGTTTIRSVLYNEQCVEVASYQEKVNTIYSSNEDGDVLVEIEPELLFKQFLRVVEQGNKQVPENATVNVALCTQRNSIVLWNRKTKKEETRIICWNDKRANKVCQKMNESFVLKTLNFVGAVLHTVTRKNRFAAAQRMKFLGAMVSHRLMVTIDKSAHLKNLYRSGELSFGCLETWLLMRCSEFNIPCVEASNISPSGMFDPWINDFNYTIMKIIGFPQDLLSPIVSSDLSDLPKLPTIDKKHCGKNLTITAILADQQAAMYGCGMWKKGDVKITLGTGTFIDIHTGDEPYTSMSGMYPLVAWRINGKPEFVAEGNAHDTAVILHWAQSIGLFDDVTKTSDIAHSVDSSNGTVFVPAFCGIQTPLNDEGACSGFLAIRPDTNKSHMVRAILESIAFRVYQIYNAALAEQHIDAKRPIRICGGVSNNDFICQCISDLLDRDIERMEESDHVAAKGVAMLAGYSQGYWTMSQLSELIKVSQVFRPNEKSRMSLMKTYTVWDKAKPQCKQPGAEVEILKLVFQLIGVNYTILDVWKEFGEQYDFGTKQENGSWSGMIGLLVEGKLDVIGLSMRMSLEREEAVLFSYPTRYFENYSSDYTVSSKCLAVIMLLATFIFSQLYQTDMYAFLSAPLKYDIPFRTIKEALDIVEQKKMYFAAFGAQTLLCTPATCGKFEEAVRKNPIRRAYTVKGVEDLILKGGIYQSTVDSALLPGALSWLNPNQNFLIIRDEDAPSYYVAFTFSKRQKKLLKKFNTALIEVLPAVSTITTGHGYNTKKVPFELQTPNPRVPLSIDRHTWQLFRSFIILISVCIFLFIFEVTELAGISCDLCVSAIYGVNYDYLQVKKSVMDMIRLDCEALFHEKAEDIATCIRFMTEKVEKYSNKVEKFLDARHVCVLLRVCPMEEDDI
ncbi:unnamed protein product [Caenorhabditis bovis]|uniref:Glycerol kinase 5 n=1 Tax=Caenorhabditis bovis TaxID=2654633 RepID=A0A8S1EGR5_9PELO|nr:unnamed protein product [Caenorhabditis bovis]